LGQPGTLEAGFDQLLPGTVALAYQICKLCGIVMPECVVAKSVKPAGSVFGVIAFGGI
jgi:Pyruvate/2-oxoacid:ferredoxin oxidoreductase delta subunit